MKQILLFLLLSSTSIAFSQQTPQPVNWTFELIPVENEAYELKAIAKIDDGWYVYSPFTEIGGPIPTTISFTKESVKKLELKEIGEAIKGLDALFEMEVIKYKKDLTLVQTIKVSKDTKLLEGDVRFMCCDHEKCMPPKRIPFSFNL